MIKENPILLNFMEYIVCIPTFWKWESGYRLYFKDKLCNFIFHEAIGEYCNWKQ